MDHWSRALADLNKGPILIPNTHIQYLSQPPWVQAKQVKYPYILGSKL